MSVSGVGGAPIPGASGRGDGASADFSAWRVNDARAEAEGIAVHGYFDRWTTGQVRVRGGGEVSFVRTTSTSGPEDPRPLDQAERAALATALDAQAATGAFPELLRAALSLLRGQTPAPLPAPPRPAPSPSPSPAPGLPPLPGPPASGPADFARWHTNGYERRPETGEVRLHGFFDRSLTGAVRIGADGAAAFTRSTRTSGPEAERPLAAAERAALAAALEAEAAAGGAYADKLGPVIAALRR